MPTRGSEATRAETRNRRLFWGAELLFVEIIASPLKPCQDHSYFGDIDWTTGKKSTNQS